MRTPWMLVAILLLPRPDGRAQESAASDPFQGLWKPVDLDLKEVGTREAFEALFKQSGSSLELPESFDEKKLSYRAKGVAFWQAVDEIARLNGNLRHLREPSGDAMIRLQEGAWVDHPRAYRGPLRMSVLDTARIREFRYPGKGDRTDVTFMLQWIAGVEPTRDSSWNAGKIRVAKIEDDTGRSLLPEVDAPEGFELRPGGYRLAPSSLWMLRFQPAGPGARKIAKIDVEWEGSLLSDIEEVLFANPPEAVGKSHRVGPMTVTLVKFEKDAKESVSKEFTHFNLTLKLSYDPETAPAEWKQSLRGTVPLSGRLLQGAETTTQGQEGTTRNRRETLWAGKSGEAWVEFNGSLFVSRGVLSSLKVRIAKGAATGKTVFSFRDVKLPEESR